MRLNKDDIYSLIGTVAFHGVILLILWFTVLKTEVPDEDGGVLVNFGNVDAAAGMFEPKYTAAATAIMACWNPTRNRPGTDTKKNGCGARPFFFVSQNHATAAWFKKSKRQPFLS